MNYWDPYRPAVAPSQDRWARALAETRRVAEQALAERDLAVRARDEALRALREREVRPPEPEPDDRAARLAADLANVRRNRDEQIARARAEERAAGVSALAAVHDDLVRAMEANPDRRSAWFQGHQLIVDGVRSRIRELGAAEVGAVGDPFDPTVHEAIGTAPGPAGVVVAVDRVGFRLEDGTLVRPAQVRVGA
jgi:molecular chaperone GrpE